MDHCPRRISTTFGTFSVRPLAQYASTGYWGAGIPTADTKKRADLVRNAVSLQRVKRRFWFRHHPCAKSRDTPGTTAHVVERLREPDQAVAGVATRYEKPVTNYRVVVITAALRWSAKPPERELSDKL